MGSSGSIAAPIWKMRTRSSVGRNAPCGLRCLRSDDADGARFRVRESLRTGRARLRLEARAFDRDLGLFPEHVEHEDERRRSLGSPLFKS